jgi:hypothetical protein
MLLTHRKLLQAKAIAIENDPIAALCICGIRKLSTLVPVVNFLAFMHGFFRCKKILGSRHIPN